MFISDATLPTKGHLIKIVKEVLFLDYRDFKLPGLKTIKEKIMLLIFIFHKIVGDSAFTNRQEMEALLVK